jgi:CRP-like cAMP-binding protein
MEKHMRLIRQARIFKGISDADFDSMLATLDSQLKHYRKDQQILTAGRHVPRAGLLLEGQASVTHDSFWQDSCLLEQVQAGDLFGESFACVRKSVANITITASTPCVVLWFNLYDILSLEDGGAYHAILIHNLMNDIAGKNLLMNRKIMHMQRKTTREKLLWFLSDQSEYFGSAEFDIPYDRQQLADYLGVERSAMSAELSKLRREGYLESHKQHFLLKQP